MWKGSTQALCKIHCRVINLSLLCCDTVHNEQAEFVIEFVTKVNTKTNAIPLCHIYLLQHFPTSNIASILIVHMQSLVDYIIQKIIFMLSNMTHSLEDCILQHRQGFLFLGPARLVSGVRG